MRKQAGASKMHQPIALVRVARPKNQREHQPGPPGDLGRTVEMNFMAEGFAPQAEDSGEGRRQQGRSPQA